MQSIDLPGSTRAGSKTLEFGTYDTSAASVSNWMTLGLETTLVPIPAAVWLFGSGLLGLIGVARRKAA